MGNTLAHTQSVVLSEEVAVTGPVLCLRSGEHVSLSDMQTLCPLFVVMLPASAQNRLPTIHHCHGNHRLLQTLLSEAALP